MSNPFLKHNRFLLGNDGFPPRSNLYSKPFSDRPQIALSPLKNDLELPFKEYSSSELKPRIGLLGAARIQKDPSNNDIKEPNIRTEERQTNSPSTHIRNEDKKEMMKRELNNTLREQIEQKRQQKELERQKRLLEDQQAEERWQKEIKYTGKNNKITQGMGRRKFIPFFASQQAETVSSPSQSQPPGEPILQVLPNHSPGIPDEEPFEERNENEEDIPQFIHNERERSLHKLQFEIEEQERGFQEEINRLREFSQATLYARDTAERQLEELRIHITKRRGEPLNFQNKGKFSFSIPHKSRVEFIPTNVPDEAFFEAKTNLGRYGKMYIASEYKSTLMPIEHPLKSKEEALFGESHMISWNKHKPAKMLGDRSKLIFKDRPPVVLPVKPAVSHSPRPFKADFPVKGNTMDVLDAIMNEFLTDAKKPEGGYANSEELPAAVSQDVYPETGEPELARYSLEEQDPIIPVEQEEAPPEEPLVDLSEGEIPEKLSPEVSEQISLNNPNSF